MELYKDIENARKRIIREHFPIDAGILNERELEVAMLIIKSLSNKEISSRLFITEAAVKSRLINIYRKLSITKREQLADALTL